MEVIDFRPRLHDTILHFSKSAARQIFHAPKVAIDDAWLKREYRHEDSKGRYASEEEALRGGLEDLRAALGW